MEYVGFCNCGGTHFSTDSLIKCLRIENERLTAERDKNEKCHNLLSKMYIARHITFDAEKMLEYFTEMDKMFREENSN